MKKVSIRNPLLLLTTAVVWGVAFVAQSVGMDYVGPFTFNFARCILGALVLIPCMFLLDKVNGKKKNNVLSEAKPETGKTLIFGGICCGAALFIASNLQQFGIQYTSVGKAGFITAMYIVLVPVLGIFLKKRAGAARLVRCCACSGGTVSFVHDRRDFRQFWRCASAAVCFCLCDTYFDYRLFFTESGRCADVLHPVFRMRAAVRCRNAADGAGGLSRDASGVASDHLCRSDVLCGWLYIADHRTEGYESDGGIFDPEP